MKTLIVLLAIFLSAQFAFAQNPVWSKKYHTGSVTCLDFSGDGKMLASGSLDSTVRTYNIDGNLRNSCFLKDSIPKAITFHKDKIHGLSYFTTSGSDPLTYIKTFKIDTNTNLSGDYLLCLF